MDLAHSPGLECRSKPGIGVRRIRLKTATADRLAKIAPSPHPVASLDRIALRDTSVRLDKQVFVLRT